MSMGSTILYYLRLKMIEHSKMAIVSKTDSKDNIFLTSKLPRVVYKEVSLCHVIILKFGDRY